MNPTYATKIKKEIDKLLQTRFIYFVDQIKWLSLIVAISKKNFKL